MSFLLRVWGKRACFPRPEFRRDCISYDVITPLAARRIFEAIHWRPAIRWHVERIVIGNPIRYERSFTEVQLGRSEFPRVDVVLAEVDYIIAAHFEIDERVPSSGGTGMHADTFKRRARKGHAFKPPSLGLAEFPAQFELVSDAESFSPAEELAHREVDLGWMIHDFAPTDHHELRYFRATSRNGIIDVPPHESEELAV